MSKEYCIASPHKNVLWYDYRLYENLKTELSLLGYKYKSAAKNRIYFLGGPLRKFYPEVGEFDHSANNIALIYCHAEKLKSLQHFDKVFVSSVGMKRYFELKSLMQFEFLTRKKKFCSAEPIEVIKPFSSLSPTSETDPGFVCDIMFVGTPRIRPIVEAIIPIVQKHQLTFKIIGPGWQNYSGNQFARNLSMRNSVPYNNIPIVANSSKICLIDHHQSMNKIGVVSHKYVDFISSGACVISDFNKDAKTTYKGLCFSSKESLESLVLTLLKDEEQRLTHVNMQLKIAANQTTKNAAISLSSFFV